MDPTQIFLHTQFQIGTVDHRIFGGFLEHTERAVYEGVYDPTSANADRDGFRRDVLKVLDRLNYSVMRYPGGNFVSGYHWMDGVGPREKRPTVRELAWQSKESNHFGTDEFLKLCRKLDCAPMLAVNLGTGTPEEACDWVEYCNAPTGTRYADLRAAHGSSEPYAIKLWCLGNEMDGPWQIGHAPVAHYAIRAQQAAYMMKRMDASLELVVCGSSGIELASYMDWDRQVLDYLGELCDYISLHRYVDNLANDTPDFLAVTNAIDRQIEEMDSVCRFVQAQRRSKKRAYLCFDEWNAWYRDSETFYNLEDALVVAGFLNCFIRHADVLKIANLAQIVNVIAPILTRGDELLIQTIFYPFEMYRRRGKGVALRAVVVGPMYEGKTNGLTHYVDTSAILDENTLHVFLTNRNSDERTRIRIELADRAIIALATAEILTGATAKTTNTFDAPERVRSQPFSDVTLGQGHAEVRLPPLSLSALTLKLAPPSP